jgi:alpha-beta hydrolase superfamily lysophospholipase
MRKWLNRYLGDADKLYLLTSVGLMMRNARFSFRDFQDLQTGHLTFSLPKMYNITAAIDLNSLGYDMPIPFFIIDGREDRIVPPDIAAEYFRKIRAPQKAMVLIDGAGHFAMMSNSDEFLRILIDRVRPEAHESAKQELVRSRPSARTRTENDSAANQPNKTPISRHPPISGTCTTTKTRGPSAQIGA